MVHGGSYSFRRSGAFSFVGHRDIEADPLRFSIPPIPTCTFNRIFPSQENSDWHYKKA